MEQRMNAFPAFIPLLGARIVIVGDGEGAEAKARLVAGSVAEVARVSEARALEVGTYNGARLVFIAVKDEGVAEQAAAMGRAAGALVNVVDRPALCDFQTPAIIDRSPVICAIGTGGAAPVLATMLRASIESRWPARLGAIATLSGELQKTVREAIPDGPARRAYWRRMLKGPAADAAVAGDMETARRLALEAIAEPRGEGKVMFLQAPAEADRLTLGALRAMGGADRIVADGEEVVEIVRYARRDAERRASATAEELAAWAADGLTVLVVSAGEQAELETAVEALGVRTERLVVAG
jgi:precorrin-2 dehydrogenase/sirohydrochlorin ferrochelatase